MKAHQLIADPKRFRQGTLCSDDNNRPCQDSEATKWDALGAIFHCYPGGRHNRPISKDDPATPCQKARELAREKYNCPLGRLDWEEALWVFKQVDV